MVTSGEHQATTFWSDIELVGALIPDHGSRRVDGRIGAADDEMASVGDQAGFGLCQCAGPTAFGKDHGLGIEIAVGSAHSMHIAAIVQQVGHTLAILDFCTSQLRMVQKGMQNGVHIQHTLTREEPRLARLLTQIRMTRAQGFPGHRLTTMGHRRLRDPLAQGVGIGSGGGGQGNAYFLQ